MRTLAQSFLAILVLSGLWGKTSAEILRVRIPVEGALCAFCMTGLKEKYQALSGITHVEVSIKKRKVDLQFDGNEGVSVQKLRQIIADYGYTPQEAILTVRGRPVKKGTRDNAKLFIHGIQVPDVFLIKAGNPGTETVYRSLLQQGEKEKPSVSVTGRLRDLQPESEHDILELVVENERKKSTLETEENGETSEERVEELGIGVSLNFLPSHILSHVKLLNLSKKQITQLKKIQKELEERRQTSEAIVEHCGDEIDELLEKKLEPSEEDERFILHELEEIHEATYELRKAEMKAALSSWRILTRDQKLTWREHEEGG